MLDAFKGHFVNGNFRHYPVHDEFFFPKSGL